MDYLILKRALGGVLLGTALFFAPFFVIKIFVFFMIAGLFFWLFKGKGYRHGRWATSDHIRSMSDEEYEQYKTSTTEDGEEGNQSRRMHLKIMNHEKRK